VLMTLIRVHLARLYRFTCWENGYNHRTPTETNTFGKGRACNNIVIGAPQKVDLWMRVYIDPRMKLST
jgi:hypothetical protein